MFRNLFVIAGAAALGLLSSVAYAQFGGGCQNSVPYQPVYQPPVYQPMPIYQAQPIVNQPPPTYVYPPQTVYPIDGAYPPTVVFTPVEYAPVEPEAQLQPVAPEKASSYVETGPVSSGSETKDAAMPWSQWADMPPLRGDFQTMLHQVAGDIDWMLTARSERFSPEVKSILVEAKTNLETSCRVCDEDPELFKGVQPGVETVRNVTEQLNSFRQLISKSLQQPSMRELAATVAPARKDKSKIGSVMGSLDSETKQNLFGMFALETLQKRGDELLTHAQSVELGTFRPVGVSSSEQTLKAGDVAPNFSIKTAEGKTISLNDYRGKKVALVFNRGHF